MVDQTREPEILEVQTANKAKQYKTDTIKLFDLWLEKCPVEFVEKYIPGGNENQKTIILTMERNK